MSSRWSVQLSLDPSESAPLSGAITTALAAELHAIGVAGPSPAEPDGPDTITFELDATEAKDARLLAQHLVEKLRAIAGLPRRNEPAPVVWVAPMAEGWASSQRFLDVAGELLDNAHVKVADFPDWPEYRAHISRRNAIAHAGQPVEEEDAKASLGVVTKLWVWLNTAAGGLGPP